MALSFFFFNQKHINATVVEPGCFTATSNLQQSVYQPGPAELESYQEFSFFFFSPLLLPHLWKCDKSEELDSFELQGGKELLESQKSGSGAHTLINKDGAAARAPAVAVYGCCYSLHGNILRRFFILTHCLKIDDEASVSVQNASTRSTSLCWQLCVINRIYRFKIHTKRVLISLPCRASHIHGVISACKSLHTH